MPVYWEGSKIVGTSGGTDNRGQPINPQGKVEGVYYGSGGQPLTVAQKAQLEAKAKFLQSPTAQWGSQESYEKAYRDYLRSGGTPIRQPAGVIPQSTMEQRRAEVSEVERRQRQMETTKSPILMAAMQRAGFDYEYILPKSAQKAQKDEVYAPRFGKMISKEEFYEKHPTPIMKAGATFEKYETQVARKLNLQTKVIEPLEEWYGTSKKGLARMGFKSEPKTERQTEEFISGAGYGIAQKPLTTAGNVAFALLVTKGAGALVSKVPAVAAGLGAGKVARNINAVNILGAGLAAAYGIDVTGRITSAPSPARKAGEITSTELIPIAMGGYLGMKPLPKPSIPSVKLKFYETNKPVSVPGMGVFYKKSIQVKTILGEKPTVLPGLKELKVAPQPKPSPKQTTETKNWINKFEDKLSTGNIVSTKEQFYGLKKHQIEMGISVEKVTGKPYEYVRGVELMKAIERTKLPRIEKIESIMKETKGGSVGLWETRAEAAAKRPPVKLMSAEERGSVIANIKKFGGLYPKGTTKNIIAATTILGIKAITGHAQKQDIKSAAQVRQTPAIATKQYLRTITELATITKIRTNLKPESFLTQVSKSVIAQEQVSKEEPKPKVKEPVRIKTTERYPERKVFPQFKPKSFLSKIDKYKRRRGKSMYKWDVENPVPDLESLGFE